MSKFSVKKPFTVLVAVVIIIVLGFVSYSRMTPDLLPSINLPYVLVTTAYPGATPEKVESTVTKPLEQAMATLENINSIQSSSNSNYSMVILEFTEDADMDSVTVDILQKINQVEGSWDDMVGTPSILKINPDMLPVTVAAVDKEGMDTAELSAFVNDTLLAKLEGTAGVADISVGGLIEQTVRVTLDTARIDALNEKLKTEIDKQLDEASTQISDAQAQLESSRAELESGKSELQDGKAALSDQTSEASAQIHDKQAELNTARTQLITQISALQAQLGELESTEQQLSAVQSALQSLLDQKDALEAETAYLQELEDTMEALLAEQLGYEAEIAQIRADSSLSEEEKQARIDAVYARDDYKATQAGFAALDAQLAARSLTREQLPLTLAQKSLTLQTVNASLDALDSTLAELGVSRDDLEKSLSEIADAKQKLTDAIASLQATLDGLDSGQTQLSAALADLEKQKTTAVFQLSDATAQLISGEAQLSSAEEQLGSGLTALEEQRTAAYESSDLHDILSMSTVSSLLTAQNFSMPAGYAEENGVQTLVSVGDGVSSLEELNNLVLLDLNMDGIDPIRLCDVATVELTDNSDEVYARINGRDGVILTFSKQSTYATAAVSQNLAARFEALSAEYDGLRFTTLMDQGDYIYLITDSILGNLLLSALFSVLVLLLFLKDLRPTLMTLCSIPLSVLFAIVLMYFSGVTLNIISLSALTVSIGMLVDNSVVVIENIYRLRHKGFSPVKAAVSGASQVAGAVTASTLTTICVFLPIVFVDGLTKQLFTDMALTLGYSLIASLIVALTLVPAMSSKLLRNSKERSHKWFDKMVSGYRRSLDWSLRLKPLVLILSVALLIGSALLVFSRGFSYMPDMHSTQLSVSVETEKDTPVSETKAITDEAMSRIQKIEGVDTVGAMLEGGGMSLLSGGSGNTATMYVMLNDAYQADSDLIADQIVDACADLQATVTAGSSSLSSMSTLGGSGISINLFCDDLDTLRRTADDIAAVLNTVEGLQNADNGIAETDPELHFVVDKEKAAEKGLTVAQVYAEISSALTNETTSTTLSDENGDYEVVVVGGQPLTPDELASYTFTVTDRTGEKQEIKLSDIASVTETQTMNAINRLEQRRYLTVTAEVCDGYNVTLVTADAEKALADYSLPDGLTMEFAGENQTIMESLEQLVQMLLLGVLLVYLIMVAQFQSLKSPLIVMFTIPLAFTGGLLGLLITGNTVSVISLIGFIMLCGIIVNNGIVLVDYINQLRRNGTSKREALLEAGATRIRPILMTSVTTILGLLVTAIGAGSGSEMMQPIAIVCIGGLIYATLMTLYVVPIMYDLFNRKELTVLSEDDLRVVSEEEEAACAPAGGVSESADSLSEGTAENTAGTPDIVSENTNRVPDSLSENTDSRSEDTAENADNPN